MSDQDIPHKMQVLVLAALAAIVWLVLGMVYFDRFIPPFDRLVPLLMPWKGLGALPPEGSLGERLFFMQGLLEASNSVAQYALAALVLFFAAFTLYLSLVYQQRQQRVRENMFGCPACPPPTDWSIIWRCELSNACNLGRSYPRKVA